MSIGQAIETLAGVSANDLAAELHQREDQADLIRAMLRIRQRQEDSAARVRQAVAAINDKKNAG